MVNGIVRILKWGTFCILKTLSMPETERVYSMDCEPVKWVEMEIQQRNVNFAQKLYANANHFH